jgi:hypothetical protein
MVALPRSRRADASIGAEDPIPEIVNHCEIAVIVPMMEKMELLFSFEPRKAAKP